MKSSASISACGRFRYKLTRIWDNVAPHLVVVMLNPSTADASNDDNTIRRVIGFAKAGSFGSIRVVNLYALRSKSPRDLVATDAVGPENDGWLESELERQRGLDEPVLAAWGSSSWSRRRAPEVLRLVSGVRWVCLGTTADGSPRHPLYVRSEQALVPFEWQRPV